MRWQHCQASTTVDATWPHRKRTTNLEKRSGEGDVDSRIQVQGWSKMEAADQNRAEDVEKSGLRQAYCSMHRPSQSCLLKPQPIHNRCAREFPVSIVLWYMSQWEHGLTVPLLCTAACAVHFAVLFLGFGFNCNFSCYFFTVLPSWCNNKNNNISWVLRWNEWQGQNPLERTGPHRR